MAKPILVTGFEAFGEHEVNVSESVANPLMVWRYVDTKIRSLILSVDFEGSKKVADMLDDEQLQQYFTLVWQQISVHPRIEIKARDILDFRIRYGGRLVKDTKISGQGDIHSTINHHDWDILSMIDSPVISVDAGRVYLLRDSLQDFDED